MVADPTAPERSRWQMFTGQSGHPASPHYDDLQADWLEGAPSRWPARGPGAELRASSRAEIGKRSLVGGVGRDHELDDLRRGLVRRAGVEGRLRVVLDPELDRLGHLRATSRPTRCSAMSIPAETPPAVIVLPSSTQRPPTGSAPKARSVLEVEPVAGRPLALEQAGGAEHERPGADRGRPFRVAVDLAQPLEDGLVAHQRAVAGAAGDEDDVGLGRPRRGGGRR